MSELIVGDGHTQVLILGNAGDEHGSSLNHSQEAESLVAAHANAGSPLLCTLDESGSSSSQQ